MYTYTLGLMRDLTIPWNIVKVELLHFWLTATMYTYVYCVAWNDIGTSAPKVIEHFASRCKLNELTILFVRTPDTSVTRIVAALLPALQKTHSMLPRSHLWLT